MQNKFSFNGQLYILNDIEIYLYLKLTVPLNIMPSGKVEQIVIARFLHN